MTSNNPDDVRALIDPTIKDLGRAERWKTGIGCLGGLYMCSWIVGLGLIGWAVFGSGSWWYVLWCFLSGLFLERLAKGLLLVSEGYRTRAWKHFSDAREAEQKAKSPNE